MYCHPNEPENAWTDALARAARRLSHDDPLAQLFFEDREDLRIEVVGEEIRESVRSRVRGLSARTRTRFLYQSDPEPEDAERLAQALTQPAPGARAQGRRAVPELERLDATAVQKLLRELLGTSVKRNPDRSLHALARWVGFQQVVLIASPGGVVQTDVRQGCRVRLEIGIERGVFRSRAIGERALVRSRDEDLEELSMQVSRRAEERLEARPAREGTTQVVFSRGVGGILVHEIVGHALEADTVLAGRSALAARARGIARPEVTVLDDPRRARAPWRIDDEGQQARATCLVQAGEVRGTISDLKRAADAGVPVTGHGRRASFHQPVLPRLGCTFLASGALDPREVVEETDSGIFVRRMEAAGTDPVTGSAFFRVTDSDRIRAGRVECALTPLLLQVTAHEALSSLDRIADDLAFDVCIGSCVRDGQPLATSVGAPTCRIGIARVLS